MEEDDNLIGKTIHGSYAILSKIGEGAMGRVYLAENVLVREKKYAVKVLKRELTANPNFMQQFYDEAAHQAQLSHPNIVQMYDYFKDGEDYFLALEYVEGTSLADMVDQRRGQPMPEKQALHIFKGVLAALNCAHEKAILHRDIKASNVMVGSSSRALLTDFGIARQAGDEQAASLGRVIGTPEYMSPEQFINSDQIDHHSDVYSAGILLFEMLTGQLPFKGTSLEELKERHLSAPVPNPRVVNPKIRKCLAEIVIKAIQKKPDARFQGGLAFLKAIERCERGRSWEIALLSLSILVAAGVWYFVENEKAARSLAMTSTDNFALLCREAETLQRKEIGLRVATEVGDSAMIETFSENIKAHKANIDKFFGEYVHTLEELSRYRQSTVRRIFKEPEQMGKSPAGNQAGENAARARFWQLTGNAYEELSASDRRPEKQAMLEKCAQ